MDKIKLKFKPIEKITIDWDDETSFECDDKISVDNYVIILENLKKQVFANADITNGVAIVKLRYIQSVLQLCTNVDVDSLSPDDMLTSGLYGLLALHMFNFEEVFKMIMEEYKMFENEMNFKTLYDSVPSTSEMNGTIEALQNAVNNMDASKLKEITNGLLINNAPIIASVKDKMNLDVLEENKDS